LGNFPAPAMSRSITNLGISVSSLAFGTPAGAPCGGRLRLVDCPVLRRRPRREYSETSRSGTIVPVLRQLLEPLTHAVPGVAGAHDRLIAVFDADFVEHARDVVADGFFRESERGCGLRIV
jgi:hypothetical protein